LIDSLENPARQLGNVFKRFYYCGQESNTGTNLELLTNNDGLKLRMLERRRGNRKVEKLERPVCSYLVFTTDPFGLPVGFDEFLLLLPFKQGDGTNPRTLTEYPL
jgi:hypothetical protein